MNKYFVDNNILPPPTIDNYITKPINHNRSEGGLRHRGVFQIKGGSNKPLVSVITVVYNGEKYLENTFLSVLNQTYHNIEYIVIDGGSTDGTLDIIRKYDNRISYWVSEPDEGISDAFNKGVSLASGEIIGIINADDWYEVDTVEKVVERFSECKADVVHGDVCRAVEMIIPDEAMLRYEMALNHPTAFVTYRGYLKTGLFRNDFRYAMDYEWMLRAKNIGLSFSYINQYLANMRLDGVSDRGWQMVLREFSNAQNLHYPNQKLFNYLFFVFQIIKRTVRNVLEKMWLQRVVRFYHAHNSLVRKHSLRV